MIKLGHEEPVASMDNSGKIIWAKHNEIQTVNIKAVPADFEVIYSSAIEDTFLKHKINNGLLSCVRELFFEHLNVDITKSLHLILQVADGERLPLAVKELGSCDLYPQVRFFTLDWGCAYAH